MFHHIKYSMWYITANNKIDAEKLASVQQELQYLKSSVENGQLVQIKEKLQTKDTQNHCSIEFIFFFCHFQVNLPFNSGWAHINPLVCEIHSHSILYWYFRIYFFYENFIFSYTCRSLFLFVHHFYRNVQCRLLDAFNKHLITRIVLRSKILLQFSSH